MDTIRSFRRGSRALRRLVEIITRSGDRTSDVLDLSWWIAKSFTLPALFLYACYEHDTYLRKRYPEAYAGARDRRGSQDGQMRVLQRQIDELRMLQLSLASGEPLPRDRSQPPMSGTSSTPLRQLHADPVPGARAVPDHDPEGRPIGSVLDPRNLGILAEAASSALVTLRSGREASQPSHYHRAGWLLTEDRLQEPGVLLPPAPSVLARVGKWLGAPVPLGPQSGASRGAAAAGGFHESALRAGEGRGGGVSAGGGGGGGGGGAAPRGDRQARQVEVDGRD